MASDCRTAFSGRSGDGDSGSDFAVRSGGADSEGAAGDGWGGCGRSFPCAGGEAVGRDYAGCGCGDLPEAWLGGVAGSGISGGGSGTDAVSGRAGGAGFRVGASRIRAAARVSREESILATEHLTTRSQFHFECHGKAGCPDPLTPATADSLPWNRSEPWS